MLNLVYRYKHFLFLSLTWTHTFQNLGALKSEPLAQHKGPEVCIHTHTHTPPLWLGKWKFDEMQNSGLNSKFLCSKLYLISQRFSEMPVTSQDGLNLIFYTRGPQPPGHGPVLACGLLGTRPHSRRWAVGERVKLHLYLQPLPMLTLLPELHLLSDERRH